MRQHVLLLIKITVMSPFSIELNHTFSNRLKWFNALCVREGELIGVGLEYSPFSIIRQRYRASNLKCTSSNVVSATHVFLYLDNKNSITVLKFPSCKNYIRTSLKEVFLILILYSYGSSEQLMWVFGFFRTVHENYSTQPCLVSETFNDHIPKYEICRFTFNGERVH